MQSGINYGAVPDDFPKAVRIVEVDGRAVGTRDEWELAEAGAVVRELRVVAFAVTGDLGATVFGVDERTGEIVAARHTACFAPASEAEGRSAWPGAVQRLGPVGEVRRG